MVYFINAYPDEDFRSIIYRTAKLQTQCNVKALLRNTFKVRPERFSPIPPHLNNLGLALSEERFLQDHSYFPLCRLSLPEDKLQNTFELLSSGKLKAVASISNLHGLISEDVRYCVQCVYEDTTVNGECFIHRIQQYNISDFCSKHKCNLISHCDVCGSALANKYEYQLCNERCQVCNNQLSIGLKNGMRDNIDINSSLKFLLLVLLEKLLLDGFTLELVHQRIYTRLDDLGYVSFKGIVEKKRLLKDLSNFFPEHHVIRVFIWIVYT